MRISTAASTITPKNLTAADEGFKAAAARNSQADVAPTKNPRAEAPTTNPKSDPLRTATLESKTNFFAAGRDGVVRAEATPLHRGRTTMVWQTRITRGDGKLAALVTQTQLVLEGRGKSS